MYPETLGVDNNVEAIAASPAPSSSDTRTAAEIYLENLAFKRYVDGRVRLEDVRPVKEYDDEGRVIWNFHEGQGKVMQSLKRFIIACAGRQSGKSETGPAWLYEEMKARGPGWYMVVAPTYPVLEDSALPKLLSFFGDDLRLGRKLGTPLQFIISEEGERKLWGHAGLKRQRSIIRFGHGTNPSSLEAKTSLACWIDEGGQPEFKRESFEAIEGRHTTTQGRILITTTPYDFGFLKTRFYDPWIKAGGDHPEIDVITWKSIANPAFPLSEYERLKETMPAWRHAMFYDGEFSVPAGLIYDVVRERESEIAVTPFPIPSKWPRYGGLDFGGINTHCIYAALDPKERVIYLYSTYYPAAARRIRDHAKAIKEEAGGHLDRVIGGARSEDQWRDEFFEGGLFVEQPAIADLHVGIGRVYSLFSVGRLRAFDNTCAKMLGWWNEVYSYRYETDPATGETLPEMKIIEQNKFHAMDSTRYLASGFSDMAAMGALGSVGGKRKDDSEYREIHKAMTNPKRAVSRMGRGGGMTNRTRGLRNPLLQPPGKGRIRLI